MNEKIRLWGLTFMLAAFLSMVLFAYFQYTVHDPFTYSSLNDAAHAARR